LEDISLQLEGLKSQQPAASMVVETSTIPASRASQKALAQSSHDLAHERAQLLATIRKQPGFERFLLPKPLLQLTPAAQSGPIVMLTLSRVHNRCYALIVLPNLEDDILSLSFESFTPSLAKQLHAALQQIISPNEVQNAVENKSSHVSTPVTKDSEKEFQDMLERLVTSAHNISLNDNSGRLGIELVPVGKTAPVTELSTFEQILAELWNHVAKPVLDGLAIVVCLHPTL
jgi:hypothetical protein